MFRLWQRWGRHTRAWRWQASWRAARVTWESAASGEVMQRWLVIHPSKQYHPSSFVHDWLKVLNMDPDVMAMLQKSISAKVIWHIMHWSPTNIIHPALPNCDRTSLHGCCCEPTKGRWPKLFQLEDTGLASVVVLGNKLLIRHLTPK